MLYMRPGICFAVHGNAGYYRMEGLTKMPHLPADITNPEKRKKVLTTLLENVNAKLAELQDRKELLEHELSLLNGV